MTMKRIVCLASILALPFLAGSAAQAEDLYAFVKFEEGKTYTMVQDFKLDKTITFKCNSVMGLGSTCLNWTGGAFLVTLKNGETLTCNHAILARKKRGSYLKCGLKEAVLINDKSDIERRCEKFVEIDEGKLDRCR